MVTPASFVPSYYLWDANAALHDYMRHAVLFESSDLPPAARDATGLHAVILEVPVARRLTYAYGWNPDYGGPPGEHYSLLSAGEVVATNANDGTEPLHDYYTGQIAQALSIDPADVPLALFCGLVSQRTTSDTDTWSGAWKTIGPLMLQELQDAFSENPVKMEADASKFSDVYAGQSAATHDESYYQVTVSNRVFLPVGGVGAVHAALEALKAAHAAGASIADALDALADQGVNPIRFRTLAGVHRANEEQALRAVNDPGFEKAMRAAAVKAGDSPPTAADVDALRAAVLLGAGAPMSSPLSSFPLLPHVSALGLLSPRLPSLSRAALSAVSARSPSRAALSAVGAPRSSSLTPTGKFLAAGAVLGALVLAYKVFA